MENPTETSNENGDKVKKRHGCVTAWLIFMIAGNSIVALIYLFAGDFIARNSPTPISTGNLILLAIGAIANVVFASMLFQWKKWGFWGIIISASCAFVINISIGLGVGQCLLGLLGIGILYAVLQIKQDDVSAWENLE